MCLFTSEASMKKSLKGKRVHSNGMVKVWKVVSKDNSSPFYHSYQWKPGWNKSNRPSTYPTMTAYEQDYSRVYQGIHVYLTRKSARSNFTGICNTKIIPVYACKKDLVAFGICDEAVFMKVFVKKEDLKASK